MEEYKTLITEICNTFNNDCQITVTESDVLTLKEFVLYVNGNNDRTCTIQPYGLGKLELNTPRYDELFKMISDWVLGEINYDNPNKKKKIVVFTGAGISAESGISTFRDSDGLWEQYKVEDVATIQAWQWNKEMMLKFYNERRKQLETVEPNKAHFDLVKLEDIFNVQIITQNVDNLHERAGSTNILHLHGELTKACSSLYKNLVVDIGYGEIKLGDLCEDGQQMRPYIVWFGEGVPKMTDAKIKCYDADILIVVGTSLQVFPACDILEMVPNECEIYYVDPSSDNLTMKSYPNANIITKKATEGVDEVLQLLTEKYGKN